MRDSQTGGPGTRFLAIFEPNWPLDRSWNITTFGIADCVLGAMMLETPSLLPAASTKFLLPMAAIILHETGPIIHGSPTNQIVATA